MEAQAKTESSASKKEATGKSSRSLAELELDELTEVMQHFRAVRSDLLRYAAWNTRSLSDDDLKKVSDRKAFGYFKQDLLETRLVDRARRMNVIEVWSWFDDIATGQVPILLEGKPTFLRIEDKDIDKVRKRMTDLRGFLPILENDDFPTFRRIKFKLRRTVLRMTYDLHNLMKRFEKYRKRHFRASSAEKDSE